MNKTFLGLSGDLHVKCMPPLDPGFMPLAKLFDELPGSRQVCIAVERPGGMGHARFNIENPENPTELDKKAALFILKSLLWVHGGFKVTVDGSEKLAEYLRSLRDGDIKFDWEFMSGVYERTFEVVSASITESPESLPAPQKNQKRDLSGCRIGFDAGGSDLKVSAVQDGEAVFSQEIVWHPKINSDPSYHYKYIVDAMKLAASKMPKVDCIGVSSAGIYVNNQTRVASLFIKVSKEDFARHVKDIYVRAAAELGNVPLVVSNDGDVTALAGSMEYGEGNVLGIAMGTSEAGGYIDVNQNITGRLNELAFVPVDANPDAAVDEWSGDKGRGSKYFSQDAVIKLAPAAGITLDESLTPAEKLSFVQNLMKEGDPRAVGIYESIGVYLGHSLAWYSRFYSIKHVPLMGRVMSGEGGGIIVKRAKETLEADYPELSKTIKLELPDEKNRRVGQSVAAAALYQEEEN